MGKQAPEITGNTSDISTSSPNIVLAIAKTYKEPKALIYNTDLGGLTETSLRNVSRKSQEMGDRALAIVLSLAECDYPDIRDKTSTALTAIALTKKNIIAVTIQGETVLLSKQSILAGDCTHRTFTNIQLKNGNIEPLGPLRYKPELAIPDQPLENFYQAYKRIKALGSNSGKYFITADGDIVCMGLENPNITGNFLVLPGTTKISSLAFLNSRLEHIDLPESLIEIGDSAFKNCSHLTEIVIPKNVEVIRGSAFAVCFNLEHIVLPDKLKEIGTSAFNSCSKLKDIELPDTLETLGWCAFTFCFSLAHINIPSNLTTISNSTFEECTSLTRIDIPENITEIHAAAFRGCTNLTNIHLPSTLTTINDFVFMKCQSLAHIELPGTLTKLGIKSFSECTSLSSITIPSSLKEIEHEAFSGCLDLENIYINRSARSISGAPCGAPNW